MTTGHTYYPPERAQAPEPRQTAQEDPLKAYLLERRRALLAEVAGIERLLGFEKKTVDKR